MQVIFGLNAMMLQRTFGEFFKLWINAYINQIGLMIVFTLVGFVTLRIGNYLPILGVLDKIALLTQAIIFMTIFTLSSVWIINRVEPSD